MAKELVFYTNPMSRGRIARWMLEEAGAAYRTEVVDYWARLCGREAYLRAEELDGAISGDGES